MPEPLTERQRQVLAVIRQRTAQDGREPTLAAIGEALGGIAPPSVFAHIQALERKGYLRRRAQGRPAIELLDAAEELPPTLLRLPITGSVAAGERVAPAEPPWQEVALPEGCAGAAPDCVLLRILGGGFAAEGLLDGDLLVVRPGAAPDGAVAVVYIDGRFATVRRYTPGADHVCLLPVGPAGEPLAAQRVEVVGQVLGVVRRYGEP